MSGSRLLETAKWRDVGRTGAVHGDILIIHIIGNVQWTYKIELSGASLRAAMTLTAGRGEAFWCNRAEPGVTPKHISQHFSKDLPSRHSSLLAAAHRISLLTLRGNR